MAKKVKRKRRRSRQKPPHHLLDRLQSDVHAVRHPAALELQDFVDNAKGSLWHSIRKRANRNHRGTLVRTLQWFNCSGDFDALLDLALNGDYEVQCHALRILQDQSFSVNKSQLRQARQSIRALRPRENLPAPALRLLRGELESALKRIETTCK